MLPLFLDSSPKAEKEEATSRGRDPSAPTLRGAISFCWKRAAHAQIAEHVGAHPPPQAAAKRHSGNAKKTNASINTMSPQNLPRQLVSQDMLPGGARMGRCIPRCCRRAARAALQMQSGATRPSALPHCSTRQLSAFQADTSNFKNSKYNWDKTHTQSAARDPGW